MATPVLREPEAEETDSDNDGGMSMDEPDCNAWATRTSPNYGGTSVPFTMESAGMRPIAKSKKRSLADADAEVVPPILLSPFVQWVLRRWFYKREFWHLLPTDP